METEAAPGFIIAACNSLKVTDAAGCPRLRTSTLAVCGDAPSRPEKCPHQDSATFVTPTVRANAARAGPGRPTGSPALGLTPDPAAADTPATRTQVPAPARQRILIPTEGNRSYSPAQLGSDLSPQSGILLGHTPLHSPPSSPLDPKPPSRHFRVGLRARTRKWQAGKTQGAGAVPPMPRCPAPYKSPRQPVPGVARASGSLSVSRDHLTGRGGTPEALHSLPQLDSFSTFWAGVPLEGVARGRGGVSPDRQRGIGRPRGLRRALWQRRPRPRLSQSRAEGRGAAWGGALRGAGPRAVRERLLGPDPR